MSMTREEAIEELERLLRHWDDLENDKRCFWGYDNEAVALALTVLRPVSREQVDVVIKSLKLRLENNEEGGVVYIPKFVVMEMIERLEAIENG